MKIKKFNNKTVYPALPARYDLFFFRIGGCGIANSMIVASRALVRSLETGYLLINPTWSNFSFGPYLRHEADKRHYTGLFNNYGVSGLSKLLILLRYKVLHFSSRKTDKNKIIVIKDLINKEFKSKYDKDYFGELLPRQKEIRQYFEKIINPDALRNIPSFEGVFLVGIHVRLGDYVDWLRTDIDWYKNIIEQVKSSSKNSIQFWLFSDGSSSELKALTDIDGVKRIFCGNALADMVALSRCNLIIASNSTFSGFAAFLNQVPVIFPKRHYGPVLTDISFELVTEDSTLLPNDFLKKLHLIYE